MHKRTLSPGEALSSLLKVGVLPSGSEEISRAIKMRFSPKPKMFTCELNTGDQSLYEQASATAPALRVDHEPPCAA
jgi:hypothetical protein